MLRLNEIKYNIRQIILEGKIGSNDNIPNVPKLEIGKICYISIT
jgi:hypothetical protein